MSDPEAITLELLLARLQLCRVGVYPQDPDASLVLDYSINRDVTNYLLAVSFDGHGAVASKKAHQEHRDHEEGTVDTHTLISQARTTAGGSRTGSAWRSPR